MKRFLFTCLGLIMIFAAQAATYEIGQPTQNDQVLLMQSYDAPQMVADFVMVDYSADMITAVEDQWVHLVQQHAIHICHKVKFLR